MTSAGFPWGGNNPSPGQRIAVAMFLGIAAAVLHYFRSAQNGGLSDFTPLWYGARVLTSHQNPYLLIGPGKLIGTPTPLLYPAPAFVSVIPLTLVQPEVAGALFVFISTALLAWGSTKDSWHRLPMFPSIAFLTSAQLGQWSILMTAAVFVPVVALVAIAKPQASLPVVGSSNRTRSFYASLAGGAVLTVLAFALQPGWLSEWRRAMAATSYFVAPICRTGGIAISLVLLRWRRSEAWLVFLAACLPQTWYPYNGLLLLTVAYTYREACVLSLFSSAAWIGVYLFLPGEMRSRETRELWGAILVATSYLPATLLILRRPNDGPGPWWIELIRSRLRPSPIHGPRSE